jgi:Ca2+-binding EF-hand superfamily protein
MKIALKTTLATLVLALSTAFATAARADDPAGVEGNPDALFKKLDTNGDGVLTASEIPAEQRKFFERLLRIGDTNKDGALSREEFDAAMGKSDKPVTDINQAPSIDAGSGAAKPNLDPKRLFQVLDKNKDGKLTRDEVQGRPRILAAFDRLGKESLTVEDLTAALGGGGGKKAAKKAQKKNAKAEKMAEGSAAGLQPFFRALDTDHDGRLSREELSKAAELFDRLDRNHDGFLDAHELSEAPAVAASEEPVIKPAAPLARVGKKGILTEQGLVQLLKRADADGDGKLSMEETPKFLKKQFSKIDTNGDGFLDKQELEAWFHRQHRIAGTTPSDGSSPATPATNKNSGL